MFQICQNDNWGLVFICLDLMNQDTESYRYEALYSAKKSVDYCGNFMLYLPFL